MDTGTRSLRKAFKKGSWRDWPLAIGFSLFLRSASNCLTTQQDRTELPCSAIQTSEISASPNARSDAPNLNMRIPSKPKLTQLADYVSIPRQLGPVRVRIDPGGLDFAAHPRELPFG